MIKSQSGLMISALAFMYYYFNISAIMPQMTAAIAG